MCVLCRYKEGKVAHVLWECAFICEFVTSVVFSEPESTWLSGEEVTESETGNRKLLARMI